MPNILSFDPGAGAIKAIYNNMPLTLLSAVAVNGQHRIHGVAGIKSRKRPLTVITPDGEFLVGAGAHDFGRPVENLDFDRLTGSPELRALLCGVFSRLLPVDIRQPLNLIVGLPIAVLSGEDATATIKSVKSFLNGAHTWQVDGQSRTVTVADVLVTGQPVGASFEFFLDEKGNSRAEHRTFYDREIGVMNVGMSTIDLLVMRRGQLIERFTAGETIGVRRLLSMINANGLYSFAELDEQLRSGRLDTNAYRAIWEREVLSYLDQVWGKARKRFSRVICTGGGVHLLYSTLLRKFGASLYVTDDPVMSTAVGLYRFGLMQARKDK